MLFSELIPMYVVIVYEMRKSETRFVDETELFFSEMYVIYQIKFS